MLINGNDLPKTIIEIVEREEKLLKKISQMNDRFTTACNLKNSQELSAIDTEGAKLQKLINYHIVEKATVMTMFLSRNKNFMQN